MHLVNPYRFGGGGGGSLSIVQAKVITTTLLGNVAHAFDAGVTAGNTVIVAIAGGTNSRTFTVTGTDGTLTKHVSQVGSASRELSIQSLSSITGGETDFTTVPNTSTSIRIVLLIEVSPASIEDSDSYTDATNQTTHYHAAVAGIDTAASAILVTVGRNNATHGTITPNTDFSDSDEPGDGCVFQWGVFAASTSGERGEYVSTTARATNGCIAAFS